MTYSIRQLSTADVAVLKALLGVFADAFGDADAYQSAVPSDEYLRALLARPHFITIVATAGDEVVGGLAAYELEKFEQQRSEMYIYDLAVLEAHRRQRIATRLIEELRAAAAARGAYVIFVQADPGDLPAIRLYESLGTREDVHHFDIAVSPPRPPDR
jgi:aminoglycoside 3-N-acetyltransferase I